MSAPTRPVRSADLAHPRSLAQPRPLAHPRSLARPSPTAYPRGYPVRSFSPLSGQHAASRPPQCPAPSRPGGIMLLERIYDPDLSQTSYLIGCQVENVALVVDPRRDIQVYLDLAAQHGMTITAVAETHIHSAAPDAPAYRPRWLDPTGSSSVPRRDSAHSRSGSRMRSAERPPPHAPAPATLLRALDARLLQPGPPLHVQTAALLYLR